MAERKLDVVIAAKDSYSKPLTQAEKSFQDFSSNVESRSKSLGKSFDSLGGSIMGIRAAWLQVAGVVAAGSWLIDGAKQALEGEKAMNKLRIQIQNTGLDYYALKGHVEEAINATSRYALVQDDEVAEVLQRLIFLTGNYAGSVENLNLVYDLTYQRGISQSEAATLIGKAMTGNIEALGWVIPEFKNLDDTLGKNASQADKAAKAMDLLRGKVSGATDEMTDHERKVQNVTLAYNNLHEAMGSVLLDIASLAVDVTTGIYSPGFLETLKNLPREQTHPLSAYNQGQIDKSGNKLSTARGGDDSSITHSLSARLRITEEGLQAVPPSLTVPVALNWNLLSDSVDMESDLSSKIAKFTEAERMAAQDSLRNLESPYDSKYTGTDQLSGIYNEYDQKLIALENFNLKKIELMITAGASELEIEAAHGELSNQYAAARRDFQIQTAGQTFGAMSNMMQNLYVLAGSKNKAMFQMMKAFAITEAVINTAQAITAAIKNPPGPPWSFAYAAAAAAAGAVQIKTIMSSEPGSKQNISVGGSAVPSYGGGSPSSYPIPSRLETEKTETRPQIVFKVDKIELLDDDSVDRLMAKISERARDYDVTLKATSIVKK